METRQTLAARLAELEPAIGVSDVLLPLPFNLPRTLGGTQTTDGIAALLSNRTVVYTDGAMTLSVPNGEIEAFAFRAGIGCVFAEFTKKDGTHHVLARADMRQKDLYAAAVKQMNRHLAGEAIDYSYEKELNRVCPKCGRPFRPGSDICDHCVDKRQYLARLWQIAHPYRFYIYASVLLYLGIAVLNLLPPYLNRLLVDHFIQAAEKPLLSQFLLVIASLLGVNIVVRLLSMVRSISLIEAGNRVIVRLREMVFQKIQMLSISRISKRTSGELMNRVSNDTATVQDFLTREMGQILEQLITFLAISIILFAYDWRLALLILLPVPLVMYLHKLFWRITHKRYNRQWTLNAKANTVLHDIFSGIRVVKAFGMEKREEERYERIIAEERDTSASNERFWSLLFPSLGFLMGIGEFFLLYYVGARILSGEMTLGEMAQFSAYVSIIYGPLRWMANIPRTLVRVMTSVVKIFDVVDESIDVADRPDAREMDIQGTIRFEHVSFGYDNTANVLKDINFEVHPGEMIGIVGRSGVGKSTLINLVMRLYDVDEGSVTIDGVDIRDISQNSLRSQIGVVLQETFLFAGTIYDNIAYAKPDATTDEVLSASKLSGAHPFIMKLPDAYNTKVGENGYTLSGGERQRVAIARALLHNPRILILDEATASLDTETEKQIQDALQKLTVDRTTLAIAHRLSTLRNATRILVLDRGTVAEIGTHEELMKKQGIYFGLVMAQRQMSRMSPKTPNQA
ncbi:MAG: ABC transporter ATP-binding protein [Eubacteriales bacterium]